MSTVSERTEDGQVPEGPDASVDQSNIVIHIGWSHVLISLVVVLGIGGALVAGLWFGRSRSAAGANSQHAQAVPPGAAQSVPSQPIRVQPRVVPQSQSGASSGGVGASIGGAPTMGDSAPDFTLKNLQGEAVSLSDFKGRPVLINFWATWCPPCRFEMPAIQRMYDRYRDEGFVVLAVDVREPISAVQQYIDQGGYTFPVLLDSTGDISDRYRIRAYPTSYFVDREGKIAAAHRGMMTEPALRQYLDRVLATQ